MINRSDRITPQSIAPNARYAAADSYLHAGLATMHRSLNPHTLLHGQAAQSGGSSAKKFLLSSTAHVHTAQAQTSDSTAVDTVALARDITAAIKAGGGNETSKSLDPSDASTQTPLQRLLLKAVNGLSPAALAASPTLLAAVQSGFQTQGGRQLALAAGIYDGSLVGDLSRPVAPAGTAQRGRVLMETSTEASTLVTKAFTFDPSIDPAQAKKVRDMLTAITENSLAMRNMVYATSRQVPWPMEIVINPLIPAGASFHVSADYRSVITLRSIDDVNSAANSIVFEAGNASIMDELESQRALNIAAHTERLPEMASEVVNRQATNIFQGGLKRDTRKMAGYIRERLKEKDMALKIESEDVKLKLEYTIGSENYKDGQAKFMDKLRTQLEKEGRTDFAAVQTYLTNRFSPRQLQLANTAAVAIETVESQTAYNHHAVFKELELARESGVMAPGSVDLLTDSSIKDMDRFSYVDTVSKQERIAMQIRRGHTCNYWLQEIKAQARMARLLPPPSEHGTPADDALLEEAGTSEGQAVRNTIHMAVSSDAAVATDGSVQAATKAALSEQCLAMAKKIMANPAVAYFLKASGKLVEPALYGLMAYQLGKALETDVKNGDSTGHAFLRELAGLGVGWQAGVAGAEYGAAAGAIIGSEIPVIGTAIGAFVGGLFGGMLGWAAGDAATKALYDVTRKPLDSLISGLIANKNAVVDARFKVTHDMAASTRYAQTATRLGMTDAAAVHFAGTLTPAEGASERFMTDLAGMLNSTHQDWHRALTFAQAVEFFNIPAAGATFASDRTSAAWMQAMFDSRLKATGDIKASLLYAQTAFSLRMTPASAVYLASYLTPAEGANSRFMMDLAGRMASSKQDNSQIWQAALEFAQNVKFFGIPATNATYASDSTTAAWMQTVFDSRLSATGEGAASLAYTKTAFNLGMTQAAAVYFASALTPAEGANVGFMTDLAGLLVKTNQDFAGAMDIIQAGRTQIVNGRGATISSSGFDPASYNPAATQAYDPTHNISLG